MAVNFPVSIQLPAISELDGNNGFIVPGLNPRDLTGAQVSTVGDFNGDGITDLIVGAPGQRGSDGTFGVGLAHVVFGRTTDVPPVIDLSSLDGTNGVSIEGLGNIDEFGGALDGAGDFNDDGIADVVVTSARQQTYVIYGDDSFAQGVFEIENLNRNTGFNIVPRANDVAGLGDINGDGVDDLGGGDTNFADRAGAVYTIFGEAGFVAPSEVRLDVSENTIRGVTSDDLDGSTGFLLREQDGDQDDLGGSIDGLGDVNGDGVDDFIVAEGDSQAYVIFGRSDRFPGQVDTSELNGQNGFVIEGDISELDLSGAVVSGIGDFNGDGLNDIGIAAPGEGRGNVYIIFGSNDRFDASIDPRLLTREQGFNIDPTGDFDFGFGNALSGGGDFNNDGFSDIAIGQSLGRPGLLNAGRVFVVFGTSDTVPANAQLDTLIASNGTAVNGDETDGFFGGTLDLTGDVNGDGFGDLIVGKPGQRVDGGAFVFFGKSGNQAPNAENDEAQVLVGGTISINVLINDSDADGDGLRIEDLGDPANGGVAVTDDDEIRYTPDAGFTGTDSFTYTVSDGNGGTSTAEVEVSVEPFSFFNMPPVDQVSAIYVGYFGRAPDSAGRDFGVTDLNEDVSQGQSPAATAEEMASGFRFSEEAQSIFPFLDPTVSQDSSQAQIQAFVEDVFGNLFNRTLDGAGAEFWVGEIEDRLDSGQNIGDVIVDVMAGATGGDVPTLQNKIEVANAYTNDVSSFEVEESVQIIGAVDDTQDSVEQALGRIE